MSTHPTISIAPSSPPRRSSHSGSTFSVDSSYPPTPTAITANSTPLPSPTGTQRLPHRANRTALRQFYGLKKQDPGAEDASSQAAVVVPEIDKEDFDAARYVQELCRTAELRELLRTENELVNEIRGLDGERKALVYDNYNKLISATDTIKKMRSNMEPLTPTTSTLEPAIAHIAQLSSSLTQTISKFPLRSAEDAQGLRKKETVRWALGAPDRIRLLVREGKDTEAREEWGFVSAMLEKWTGVKGVQELRERGERALKGESLKGE